MIKITGGRLKPINAFIGWLCITGNFEEAKQYLFESLRRRQLTQGTDHHDVGHTKNCIGVMYGLMGDRDMALKYYCEGNGQCGRYFY